MTKANSTKKSGTTRSAAVGAPSKSLARDVEMAGIALDQGLRALNELAKQRGSSGVSGETLAICVEQVTNAMRVHVGTLYDIADGRYAADWKREAAHGQQ